MNMAYEGVAFQRNSSDKARANQAKRQPFAFQTGPKWCVRCGRKWKQDGDLCRECSNEVNGYVGTKQREAAHVAATKAADEQLDRLRPVAPACQHHFRHVRDDRGQPVVLEVWNGNHWWKKTCPDSGVTRSDK